MYKILNGNLDVPTDDFLPNQRPSREGYFKGALDYNISVWLVLTIWLCSR